MSLKKFVGIKSITLLTTFVLSLATTPTFAAAADPDVTGTGIGNGTTTICEDNGAAAGIGGSPTVDADCIISITLAENSTWTGTYTSNTSALWTKVASGTVAASTDSDDFAITTASATTSNTITFSAKDYEAPADSNTDNVYKMNVKVCTSPCSGGTASDATGLEITVTVTPVNEFSPAITSNGGGSTASINVSENLTAVTTVTASDVDAGASLTFSIIGGADQAKFSINSSSGELTFTAAPNFEVPTDSGTNNTYVVDVQVSDGANTDNQVITVTVDDANEGPTITSPTSFNVAEATTAVTTLTATDVDASTTLTWTKTGGGADEALFALTTGGVLTFTAAPDYEVPTDSDTNNTYVVEVQVSDGSLIDTKTITVTVTNIADTEANVSGPNEIKVREDVSAVQVIGTFEADLAVTWSLGGPDAESFSISASGGLKFAIDPDYEEGKRIYSVTVRATNIIDQTREHFVTVYILDVEDETAPIITGPDSLTVVEESAIGTVLYQFQSNERYVSWTLSGADAASFTISSDGRLALAVVPDFEGISEYSIAVELTDFTGNSTSKKLKVLVAKLDESTNGGGSQPVPPSEQAKSEKEIKEAFTEIRKNLESSGKSVADLIASGEILFLGLTGVTEDNRASFGIDLLSYFGTESPTLEQAKAFAKKWSIAELSKNSSVGKIKGVTVADLISAGLLDSKQKSKSTILAKLRKLPITDRDSVLELEKEIARIIKGLRK